MTDPLTTAVFAVTFGVALLLGWLTVPSTPELDEQRWFKLMIATLLRGRVDKDGGEVNTWRRAVDAEAPYHPLATEELSRLLTSPRMDPGRQPRPGELALVERLQALEPEGRVQLLFVHDELGKTARHADPYDLGHAYDLASILGPGGGWDELADWGADEGTAFLDALRRLDVAWLGFGEHPVVDAVLEVTGGTRLGDVTAHVQGSSLDARFVLVASGAAVLDLLKALASDPLLRDRTVAVVSVAGVLGGYPDRPVDDPLGATKVEDWMGVNFRHGVLCREIVGRIPYVSLAVLDPTSPPSWQGLPIDAQHFPLPEDEGGAEQAIARVDLGVIYPDADATLVARGLYAVVTCLVRRAAAS